MIDTHIFLLNKELNKKSVNKDISLNVELSGNEKILPEDSIVSNISSYDVYVNERSNSNKFRLIFNINSVCSNVLFNPFTEIVKNEGDAGNVKCLNFENINTEQINSFVDEGEQKIIGKGPDFIWSEYEAIRDTQISNERFGFEYHCGLDMFNNHILRSTTFKSINYSHESSEYIGSLQKVYGDTYNHVYVVKNGSPRSYLGKDFNTIDDYARDKYGHIIPEEATVNAYSIEYDRNSFWKTFKTNLPLHVYENSDVYSFKNAIKNRLINNNGWYGFNNPSIFSYSVINKFDDENKENKNHSVDLGINKAINYKKYCEFIDLYPGKDLYSFSPKFNKYRNRLEYNWNYCLTYPSENLLYYKTMEDQEEVFPFFTINKDRSALRALMIDEYVVSDDGINLFTVYSVCKHGLMVGDTVNIYKAYTDEGGDDVVELPYESVSVLNVVDGYIFQVAKNDTNVSEKWIELTNIPENYLYTYNNDVYYVTESKRVNVDPKAQNIYFRKVVDNVECEYYVRKFSRVPNFKFRDEEVNDYTLYDSSYNRAKEGRGEKTLIKKFSDPTNNRSFFDNHIAKLGFSKNAYGDDNTELVFTDDIDVSYLRDNLGRPLSSIYLTIVKNNKGYKEWYGIDEFKPTGGKTMSDMINLPGIEYSHCFGKVNSSFLLSEYYRKTKDLNNMLLDVRDINGVNNKGLLNSSGKDDVDFYHDYDYYGDICCYSPSDCDEQVLQTAMHRFNTVQREIGILNAETSSYFGNIETDEILNDDYNVIIKRPFKIPDNFYDYFNSENSFMNHTTQKTYSNLTKQTEGYYYQAHYRIPIKTISNELSSSNAIEYNLYKVERIEGDDITLFELKTIESNDFCKNEKIILHKRSTNEYFYVTVVELITNNRFRCKIEDIYGECVSNIDGFTVADKIDDFLLLKKHLDTPYYARLAKDGSCKFQWRNIISNGFENEETIYPFANGAFYITQQINFFLRRQDPAEEYMYNDFKGIEYEGLIPEFGEFIDRTPNIKTDPYKYIEPC